MTITNTTNIILYSKLYHIHSPLFEQNTILFTFVQKNNTAHYIQFFIFLGWQALGYTASTPSSSPTTEASRVAAIGGSLGTPDHT